MAFFRWVLLLLVSTFTIGGEVASSKVCVVGTGTIGSSFAAVFLAQGKTVVCSDTFADSESVQQRISNIWPTLQARGLTKSRKPDFSKLSFEPDLNRAIENVELVQECVFEDTNVKQDVLRKLDEIVDPSVVIASSTSYIPLDQLITKCKVNKDRVIVAHPSIPHWGSFMELCGNNDAFVQSAKEWYASAGFECIVMQKTIPGHVWNSFMMLNLRHGEKLVKDGVCSAEDVNFCLRHLGREFYARNLFLSLLVAIGGERGLEGGIELRQKVIDNSVAIVFSSLLRRVPGSKMIGKGISKLFGKVLVPPPVPDWVEGCREFEKIVTDDHRLDVQTGLLEASREMYRRLPLEVGRDPLALKRPTSK